MNKKTCGFEEIFKIHSSMYEGPRKKTRQLGLLCLSLGTWAKQLGLIAHQL